MNQKMLYLERFPREAIAKEERKRRPVPEARAGLSERDGQAAEKDRRPLQISPNRAPAPKCPTESSFWGILPRAFPARITAMTILVIALACFAIAPAGYFILLVADGRRLRERMRERLPRFVPEEAEPETPLFTADHALWMSPPFAGRDQASAGRPRPLYSTTPESPGLG